MLDIREDTGQMVGTDIWANQLISQEYLWPKINQSIQDHRFPHFSLLMGRPGNGQIILALSIAQTLLCKSERKPCGTCDACYKVQNCIHPDLHFSFPINNSKGTCQQYYKNWRLAISEKPFMSISDWFGYLEGDNQNVNIAVNEVNNILSLLYLKPYESESSVLIIWLPEYLGKESNRLLKFLEEPPDNVFIVLAAENSDLLLPTVRSRAQVFQMQPIQPNVAALAISGKLNLNLNIAYSSLFSTNGNIQDAITQLVKDESDSNLEEFKKLIQSAIKYNVAEMLAWIDSFISLKKEEQKMFLQWTQNLLSIILRAKYTHDTNRIVLDNTMAQYAEKISGSLTSSQIEQWNTLIDDIYIGMHHNGNIKIMLTNYLIKLAHILRNTISKN